jgi:hypothetical protein
MVDYYVLFWPVQEYFQRRGWSNYQVARHFQLTAPTVDKWVRSGFTPLKAYKFITQELGKPIEDESTFILRRVERSPFRIPDNRGDLNDLRYQWEQDNRHSPLWARRMANVPRLTGPLTYAGSTVSPGVIPEPGEDNGQTTQIPQIPQTPELGAVDPNNAGLRALVQASRHLREERDVLLTEKSALFDRVGELTAENDELRKQLAEQALSLNDYGEMLQAREREIKDLHEQLNTAEDMLTEAVGGTAKTRDRTHALLSILRAPSTTTPKNGRGNNEVEVVRDMVRDIDPALLTEVDRYLTA